MAGFSIPETARILAVEIEGVGREYPLSTENSRPCSRCCFVPSFEAGIEACAGILNYGGRGHTCVIFSSSRENVKAYGMRMPAFRVLVNTSSPQGSTGITTNVAPAMTLGCGAMAGNSTSDNVGPLHLINIKRIAFKVRDTEDAFISPEAKAYFRGGDPDQQARFLRPYGNRRELIQHYRRRRPLSRQARAGRPSVGRRYSGPGAALAP